MSLNPKQRSQLKKMAHNIKPVVTVGQQGLTQAVLTELDTQLKAHELIKVKLPVIEKDAKDAIISALCDQCRAESVAQIGRICTLYRAANPPRIKLTN